MARAHCITNGSYNLHLHKICIHWKWLLGLLPWDLFAFLRWPKLSLEATLSWRLYGWRTFIHQIHTVPKRSRDQSAGPNSKRPSFYFGHKSSFEWNMKLKSTPFFHKWKLLLDYEIKISELLITVSKIEFIAKTWNR